MTARSEPDLERPRGAHAGSGAAGSTCLSADDAAGFVAGELDDTQRRSAAGHLDLCDDCRRLISALAGAEQTSPGEGAAVGGDSDLTPGQTLGRFTLTRLVGHGSMGEVWAAHDVELDREVALKLLRLRPGSLTGDATTRLRREAQAMARLHHPNVVTIYDLGTDRDQVFCAMELIDGTTLHRWLDGPRPWRAVLGVATAAGDGVAAAHAAGLVHRDIKPENILIDASGRAVVSDFGLAKLVDLGSDDVEVGDPVDSSGLQVPSALTATGAVIGTPVYMAPEQLAGRSADARSDQFSYCATVYEALFGKRPFGGDTLDELAADIQRGPRRPAQLRGVPAGVVRCLLRGLATEPAARWPSVAALVGELRSAARRPRRLRIAAAAAVAVAVAFGVAMTLGGGADDLAAERAATAQRVESAWSTDKAQALRAAFAATRAPLAGDRAAAAIALLDRYRAAWSAQRLDAWSATHVRRDQPPEVLERRLVCLDQLADTLAGVVEVLLAAVAADVEGAPQIVARLQPVATCADLVRLAERAVAPSTPAGQRAEHELRELDALQIAGKHAEVLRRAQALVADAERTGSPEVLARARFDLGAAQAKGGHAEDAEATLRLAVQDAAVARDHYLVAEAWLWLLDVTSIQLSHLQAADAMVPAVRAAVAQAGNDPRQFADLAMALGTAAMARGDLATAHDQFTIARERRIAARGPNDPAIANDESNLAAVLVNLGELDQATEHTERAIAIIRASFGERHPVIARAEHHLAAIAARRHDWTAAERHARVALADNAAVRGADSPETTSERSLLATALREQHRFSDARVEIEQARASLSRRLPANHPDVILLDLAEAKIASAEGLWDDAERLARRCVDGLRHTDVGAGKLAIALSDLAEIIAHRSPADALTVYDETLRVYTQLAQRDPAGDLIELRELAEVALKAHQPAAALKWFDRLPEAAGQLTELRTQLERAARH